jgi:hypothetical protein
MLHHSICDKVRVCEGGTQEDSVSTVCAMAGAAKPTEAAVVIRARRTRFDSKDMVESPEEGIASCEPAATADGASICSRATLQKTRGRDREVSV